MDSSTIQIANLDPSIDNRKLEEIFSDHGPLKRCFVVKKTRKGIVQFALNDDVNKLFEETNGKLKFENDNVLELQRIPDEKPKGGTSNAKKVSKKICFNILFVFLYFFQIIIQFNMYLLFSQFRILNKVSMTKKPPRRRNLD